MHKFWTCYFLGLALVGHWKLDSDERVVIRVADPQVTQQATNETSTEEVALKVRPEKRHNYVF